MKAMSDAGCWIPEPAVVAHTLQLAVNEGLLAQRRLADATADGGKIAQPANKKAATSCADPLE